jgi:RNA polymerase sigma-70 factor, ECF subfamily
MKRSSEEQMEESCEIAESSPVSLEQGALEQLMTRYQQADQAAARTLVARLSPQLYRFFAAQLGSAEEAADMLQDAWLRIHRVRHTYRAGDPVLPWVYAIARCVRVDSYRKRRRIASREVGMDILPERPQSGAGGDEARLPSFDRLIADLPASQREVLTLLKVNGLSLEEVARATSSSVGSVKQKVHRAYERLRTALGPLVAGKRSGS